MRFFVKPWLTALSVFFFSLFIGLGFWQLHRYHYKQALLAGYAAVVHLPAIDWQHLLVLPQKADRKVSLQGRFDVSRRVYLTRLYQGRYGYDVLTPFQPAGSNAWVLVDQGWVAVNPRSQRIALLPEPSGNKSITGRVKVINEASFVLGGNVLSAGGWPLIVQNLDWTLLKQRLPGLETFIIRQSAPANRIFVRDWPVTNMLPQRHMAYAVQWFLMALVLLIVFIVFSRKNL